MTEVIDGWNCVVTSDERNAQRESPEMTASYSHADGLGLLILSEGACDVPPAVLAWLIRPLLHDAWEEGGECDGSNPYTDEPKP